MEFEDGIDLASDGIKPGDWFAIFAIKPGQQVSAAGSKSWILNKK